MTESNNRYAVCASRNVQTKKRRSIKYYLALMDFGRKLDEICHIGARIRSKHVAVAYRQCSTTVGDIEKLEEELEMKECRLLQMVEERYKQLLVYRKRVMLPSIHGSGISPAAKRYTSSRPTPVPFISYQSLFVPTTVSSPNSTQSDAGTSTSKTKLY
jgi:hypothetical protein